MIINVGARTYGGAQGDGSGEKGGGRGKGGGGGRVEEGNGERADVYTYISPLYSRRNV